MLPLSQFLLLQTASPAAIIRLESTALEAKKEIREMYFKELHHQSIEEFLTNQLQRREIKGGLLIQVILLQTINVLYSLLFDNLPRSQLTVICWHTMNWNK